MLVNQVHLVSGFYFYQIAGELKDSLCFASHDSDSPSHMHGTHSDNLYTNESRKGLALITGPE